MFVHKGFKLKKISHRFNSVFEIETVNIIIYAIVVEQIILRTLAKRVFY